MKTAHLLQQVSMMAESLGIACPRLTEASEPIYTAARACTDDVPQGAIEVDGHFLKEFGADLDACWAVMAHEVGHIYWELREDLATAMPGVIWEDSADFTAGQLTAAHGRHPIEAVDSLQRVLSAYRGLEPAGIHRGFEARRKVILQGYACWAKERCFR